MKAESIICPKLLSADLEHADPAIYSILQNVWLLQANISTGLLLTHAQEKRRQKHFINLIPSENFTSQAVLDALGSVMQSPFHAGKVVTTLTSSRQILRGLPRSPILRW